MNYTFLPVVLLVVFIGILMTGLGSLGGKTYQSPALQGNALSSSGGANGSQTAEPTVDPQFLCGRKSTLPAESAPNWTCSDSTAFQVVPDGYYTTGAFGCNTGKLTDLKDACTPLCLNTIPECNGLTGRQCEESLAYYAGNMDQYGCNTKLKITNPTTGKAVIVVVIDRGPNCAEQGGRGKLNLSQVAYEEVGAKDTAMVQVEQVARGAPLGPVAACQ